MAARGMLRIAQDPKISLDKEQDMARVLMPIVASQSLVTTGKYREVENKDIKLDNRHVAGDMQFTFSELVKIAQKRYALLDQADKEWEADKDFEPVAIVMRLARDSEVPINLRRSVISVLAQLGKADEVGSLLMDLIQDKNVERKIRKDFLVNIGVNEPTASEFIEQLVSEGTTAFLLRIARDNAMPFELRFASYQSLKKLVSSPIK
jgi:uncharacterized protein (UPF0147 family)